MSPDSWSQPTTHATPQTTSLGPGPETGIPDLVMEDPRDDPNALSSSPFQPSSFSRPANALRDQQDADSASSVLNDPVPLTQYPLWDDSAATVPAQSSPGDFQMGTVESGVDFIPELVPAEGAVPDATNFRPDLGHRSGPQTIRPMGSSDFGQTYDFETNNQQHPRLREILATGRYFGSAEVLDWKPSFQSNTAISIEGPGIAQSIPYDFDYDAAPHFRFGFESKYGPGIEFDYWQYDNTSNTGSFSSDGTTSGTSSAWMSGASRWSRLTAGNAGQQLDTTHSLDVESFGISFFKEMKFRISRLNGKFGYRYTSISQSMDSVLVSGGGAVGSLVNRSDLNAWGPQFSLEYYRPIGHTRLELLTTFGGSAMFGDRNQFVSNTATGEFDRIGADEFVTTLDFLTGVQYKKMTAENRSLYARIGLNYQSWIGGGTAIDPQGDFGLRGFSFGVGYNR